MVSYREKVKRRRVGERDGGIRDRDRDRDLMQNVLSVSAVNQQRRLRTHSQTLNVSDRGRSCHLVEQHHPLLLRRHRVESVHEPQRRLGMGLWSASEGLQGQQPPQGNSTHCVLPQRRY